jgi:hypothetical protein
VQEVMAAMATVPWPSRCRCPSSTTSTVDAGSMAGGAQGPSSLAAEGSIPRSGSMAGASLAGKDSWDASSTQDAGRRAGPRGPPSSARKAAWAAVRGTRSCGRRGPARDATTLDRSSSTCSE